MPGQRRSPRRAKSASRTPQWPVSAAREASSGSSRRIFCANAPAERTKARPRPGLRWTDGALARRGAGSRRQGRAAPASAILARASRRDPWLSCPNRSTSTGSSATWFARPDPARRHGSAPSTTSSRRSPTCDPERAPSRRRLSARRSPSAAPSARTDSRAGARRRAPPGFADTLLQAIGELDAALVDPDGSTATSPRLVEAYRDELDDARAPRSRRRAARRGRAARAATSMRGAGAPVFAYGFEDLTGAEWALLETLAARTDVTVSIPYEPGRAAFARSRERSRISRHSPARSIEELPPAATPDDPRGARPPRATALPDDATPGPSLDGSIRFLEGARHARNAELVAERGRGTAPGRHRPGASRGRVRVGRSLASAARRRRSRSSGLPLASSSRGASASRLSARRCCRSSATRGSAAVAAISSRSSGRRSRGSSVGRSTSSRVASAVGPSRDPARVEEEGEKLRGAPVPAARRAARGERRSGRGTRTLLALDDRGTRGGSSRRRRATTPASTREPTAPPSGRSTSSRRSRRGDSTSRPRTCSPRSSARRVPSGEPGARTRRGARPRARADARVRRRLRARSRGRVRSRAAGGRRRSSSDELRAELGGRLERPDAVAPRPLPLLHDLHARVAAARARPRGGRATRACRASRARSGRTSERCSTTADVQRATRRRPLSALTWPLESAPSERERLRALVRLAADDADGADALAAANDWSRRLDRARGAFDRDDRSAEPGRSRAARGEDGLLGDGARAVRRLLVGAGSSSASSTRRRSTPSPTRCCAARSCTRR